MDLTMGLGGLVGAGINAWSQHETNKANIGMQRETNAMQVDLANTAYKRKMNDMREAGLNPILAAGGAGAATPALTAPQARAPQVDTNAMRIDGSAMLPLLTMANDVAISGSEAARASAEASLAKTKADIAEKYGDPQAAENLLSTTTGNRLKAVELQVQQAITPDLIRQAKAEAMTAASTARYSDERVMADTQLKQIELSQLKRMISDNIGTYDQTFQKMSLNEQQAALNVIIGKLKNVELGQKILELIKTGATLPAQIGGAYIDAAKAAGRTK